MWAQGSGSVGGSKVPQPHFQAYPGEWYFVDIQIHRALKHGSFGRGPGDGMAIISDLVSEKSQPYEQTT